MPTVHKQKMIWQWGAYHIPVFLYVELRNNTRISIGKDAVHFRVPALMGSTLRTQQIEWAKQWTKAQLQNKPALGKRFTFREYKSGMVIKTPLKSLELQITRVTGKKASTKIVNDRLQLALPNPPEGGFSTQFVQKLISNEIGKTHYPWFSEKVDSWNQSHFNEQIDDLKLKYLTSKWGSCSSNRRMVFSTRLLLAPERAVDYVIVHELAHLKELNHSRAFWKWVDKAMPDFKKWDALLRKNGDGFDF